MYVFTVLQDSLVVSEPSTEREYPQVIEFNDEEVVRCDVDFQYRESVTVR